MVYRRSDYLGDFAHAVLSWWQVSANGNHPRFQHGHVRIQESIKNICLKIVYRKLTTTYIWRVFRKCYISIRFQFQVQYQTWHWKHWNLIKQHSVSWELRSRCLAQYNLLLHAFLRCSIYYKPTLKGESPKPET